MKRVTPSLLALCLGLPLALTAAPAFAAGFDGKWVADIPAQGRCSFTGTMTLLVSGQDLSGTVSNPPSSGVPLAHFTGHLSDDGHGAFTVNGRYAGTMQFSADHFDATWANGACDRHAQGDRAPDAAQLSAQTVDRKQHQDVYADLVRRAQAGETINYTALRSESVYAPDWDFYDNKVRGLLDQANAAAKGKDCPVAMEKLDQVLKLDFTVDSAHALRADCLKKAGDADKARIEENIAQGLIHSLMDSPGGEHGLVQVLTSSDGSTEQSAYVVTSLREEQDVLVNRHVELKTRQTEIRGSNGHYYDLVHGIAIYNGGPGHVRVEPKDVYFDITGFAVGRASRRATVQTAAASIK